MRSYEDVHVCGEVGQGPMLLGGFFLSLPSRHSAHVAVTSRLSGWLSQRLPSYSGKGVIYSPCRESPTGPLFYLYSLGQALGSLGSFPGYRSNISGLSEPASQAPPVLGLSLWQRGWAPARVGTWALSSPQLKNWGCSSVGKMPI